MGRSQKTAHQQRKSKTRGSPVHSRDPSPTATEALVVRRTYAAAGAFAPHRCPACERATLLHDLTDAEGLEEAETSCVPSPRT
jgi:hypothetical protein